jgi:hypothetical protein
LLGAWRGFNAQTNRDRLIGYLLFHLGLAAAFFAKNLLGWLTPLGAFVGVVIWERRWRELIRWELYAGLALQFALIFPWIVAVGHRDDGTKLLRIFLVDNTLGRLLPIATEDQYQLGHSNHPGKYLLELPYYLLPWTFATIAAGRWVIRQLRNASSQSSALRFAILSIAPGFLFLSFSKTARDVYVAPDLLGFAIVLGLWFAQEQHDRFDRICLRLTALLATIVGAILIALSFGVPLLQNLGHASWPLYVAPIIIGVIAWFAFRVRNEWPNLKSVTTAWSLYAIGIVAVCVSLFPTLDPSQDLRPTVEAIAQQFGSRPMAIMRDDETMRAYLDFGGGITAKSIRELDDAVEWLNADSQRLLVIELSTDHITPAARAKLASWHEPWGKLAPVDINRDAIELQKRGLRLLRQYAVIGGRTYGVLASVQQ